MARVIPDDFDALLTRDRTAEALTASGFPVRAKTLATKAVRGGGPPFRHFGMRPLYRWGDALDWAKNKLSLTRTSTSEIEAGTALERRKCLRIGERSPRWGKSEMEATEAEAPCTPPDAL